MEPRLTIYGSEDAAQMLSYQLMLVLASLVFKLIGRLPTVAVLAESDSSNSRLIQKGASVNRKFWEVKNCLQT